MCCSSPHTGGKRQVLLRAAAVSLAFALAAPTCQADVLNRAGWVVSASVGASPGNAIDGNLATRWTTGVSQANGQWFVVDTGAGTPPTFTNAVLDAGTSAGDYPRGYQLHVSSDGTNWGSLVASGVGSSGVTTIKFSPRTARFVRITQTGTDGLWWSIHELNILGIGPPPPPGAVRQAVGDGQIRVSWNTAPGATGYTVKRSTTYGGPYTVIASNLTSLFHVDTTAANGTLYFYVVSAKNGYGESPDSSQAMAGWRLVIPTLNTNERVVAATTPQEYGARGDGVTDDSAAFQAAINAVYNAGGSGGGVVFVPTGHYAFYTNLTVPVGVTLHGDWRDWTRGGGGMVGTTFKVYHGAGQPTNAPFIKLYSSTALKGVNIWYPNQSADHIVAYPYSIGLSADCVVQNVALVNSYQGIEGTGGSKSILSTVAGSPLAVGIILDQIYDIPHTEDIRFSPDIWPQSGVANAPAPGGPHAAWMRANGQGMVLIRVDGLIALDTFLKGYNVGILCTNTGGGDPGATFYMGSVSDCGTALLAQNMPGALGLMFANVTLDGDTAVARTLTNSDANIQFNRCQITGRTGVAVRATGTGWHSWMQFQNCTISNALQLDAGVFNLVNCSLSGATQCVMSATATRAAFTGCTFSPARNIVNLGNPAGLLIDPRPAGSNAMPMVYWTNIVSDYLARRPAKTGLYVATEAPWGATGNGSTDDTAAIQAALDTAGAAGGGIVFLPGGKYKLGNTLAVPAGVELRGTYELRHRTWPGADGKAKGAILQPYAGQGTTNGPVAVALGAGSGLVGVTISYETQGSNCVAFPATIQGRGPGVYVIGVVCPNPYYYVDLDTYTCTNHFLYLVDGWALKTGYKVGRGSSGTIVDCHGNWTYWIDNYDSQSCLRGDLQPPVMDFIAHNLEAYVLGDCTELLVKNFMIPGNTFMVTRAQAGRGPNATLISDYCDAMIRGFVLDSAAPSTITAVNTPMAIFNFENYADLAASPVGVLATTNFQGTATFFNTILFAAPYWDFDINGGNVTLEVVHMDNAKLDSAVRGGAFRLVNNSSRNTGGNNLPYTVTFGPGAGLAGQTNEFIACYNYYGYGYTNSNPGNPVNVWANFGLGAYPPVVSGLTATPGSGAISVSWNAAGATTAYILKRSALSDSGPFTPLATITGTSFTDLDVLPGATYYYVVSTLGPYGEGVDSTAVGTRDVLLNRSGWIATASGGEPPGNAIDGNPATRWSTSALQTSGQWFQVDMRSPRPLFKLVLDATASAADYPRGYQVYLSNDGSNWGSPVAVGTGASAVTVITFPLQTARYIRIVQTGSATGNYWSIHEWNAYGRPPNTPEPLAALAYTNRVVLNWPVAGQATAYTVKRSMVDGGPYTAVAAPVTNGYTDTAVVAGTVYYYVVSAVNAVGESSPSAQASARPVALTPPQVATALIGGQLRLDWPAANTGWRLEAQTNSVGLGLGANWSTVANSTATNQVLVPVNPEHGSVFFRLVYP